MNLFQASILGILQGLTEFLPVSSSGHLVIVQSLIPGFSQPGIFFDVVLHAGTTLSVLIYFRKNVIQLFKKYFVQIIIGTIPAVFLGLIFQEVIEQIFSNITIVALALIVTSLMNYLINGSKTKKTKVANSDSLFIGLAQAFAMIPGISRSGSTIFAATQRKINRKQAAEFSFLLSVPAVLGANVLQLFKYRFSDNVSMSFYSFGFLAAFLSGLIAINLVFSLLKKKKFNLFALYCFVLGVLVLII